ncbi:hypothetical protein Pla123a_46960 [Posidoniimonas polymericola]|uniref:Pseudopilin GspJ n=1 Tax=Posidoniimonas polymericola TaxID=2528002 RepID=A0A5C5XXH6_9BACT|nr:hypothetical protein [Posidoniimonas polymericola]TWT66302.1 hypothetical protein Pla123a_46960 [Posidoniimonas polymericola]
MSLIEVMAAAAITGALMASSVVLLRSSYAVWQAHDADHEQAENAHGVLRHIVRTLRQATAVTSITGPTDDAGELAVVLASGDTIAYTADAPGSVWYWTYPGPVGSPLTRDVDSLVFTGLEADGVTVASDPSLVQLVRVRARFGMPSGGDRTVTCSAWIRSW